jgi:hypothetical protein
MRVKSRSSNSGEFELGVIVRVKANGNYDIEKRVDDVIIPSSPPPDNLCKTDA